jgi:hypothetical protein
VLTERGIGTVEALVSLPSQELAAMPGFGPSRAAAIALALAQLQPPAETSKGEKKKDKKSKKKKRSKNLEIFGRILN